jgi:hypothetical protein
MALIKCKECGTEISDKAAACVKCGAPIAKEVEAAKAKFGCASMIGISFLVIVGFVAIVGQCSKSDDGKSASATTRESACAKDDLQCLGDRGTVAAGVYCQRAVESLATHSVKWTDGTFETKFSRFRWKDKATGVITYIGDRAEFQNGFGAFTPVIYECDLASDEKTVLDARVHEGRLPIN